MREQSITIPAKNGLRLWGDKRNESGYMELYNLKPYKEKLVPFERISTPATSIATAWPLPQMFCLHCGTTVVGASTRLYTLTSAFAISATLTHAAATTLWTIADYIDYVVLCNGTGLFVRDPSTGVISAYTGSDMLGGRSICDFKGQMITAAPSGYDTNVVMWGPIGKIGKFDATDPTSGWMPMPWSGYAERVHRLGEYLVVFGSGGVAALKPFSEPAIGMRLYELSGAGIASIGAMAGGQSAVVYVREDGMLCKVHHNPQYPTMLMVSELGYQEFFSPMLGEDIMMAYDPLLEEYYISDGTESYLLSKDGLCGIDQCVASCQVYGGGLVGTSQNLTDTGAYLMTSTLDFGQRSRKSLEWIEVCSDTNWVASVYWKDLNTGSYGLSPDFPISRENGGRVKVSGVDLRLRLEATTPAEVDYITVRFKHEDKRFVRGADAGQASARANS